MTYTFTATPLLSIFNAPVSFGLSGLPSTSYNDSFSPATIAAGTSGAQTVTLTIQVPGTSAALRIPDLGYKAWATLMACLLPLVGFRRRRANSRLGRVLLLLVFTLVGLAVTTGLTACNSNDNGYEPPQTYPLIVTATSGSSSPTATVTLIVGTTKN